VSGRLGPPDDPAYPGLIERSDDRGATWQALLIPGSDDKALPYIAAVDPQNPDVLYVRLDGSPTDQLLVSGDGGKTWTKVFETQIPGLGDTADLLGFALSPDGGMVAVGGPKDGLWIAPASTLAFTKVSTMSALCLTWSPDGLYGCADELADGFTAGISIDQGKTWAPLLHLAGLCGPLACGAESGVTQRCTDLWPLMAAGLGAPGCQGTASSNASSGATGGGGGGGSCSCALAGGNAGPLTSLAAVLLGAGGLAARRRRRWPLRSR
jgi:MYXO-CTERM domain-containing protein